MNKNLKTISFAFAMFTVVGMISSTSVAFSDDDEIELEAYLTSTSGETGEASFEDKDGQTELEIEIESLADRLCEVSINGAVVPNGPHQLDDEGELELVPSPITPIVGDSITVVVCGNEFSGTFALESDDDNDDDDSEESLKVKVNHRRR